MLRADYSGICARIPTSSGIRDDGEQGKHKSSCGSKIKVTIYLNILKDFPKTFYPSLFLYFGILILQKFLVVFLVLNESTENFNLKNYIRHFKKKLPPNNT